MSEPAGRRNYDVTLIEFMEERMARLLEEHLRDTRHTMRSEIAALTTQVVAGNLQSATEHARVHASLDFVQRDLADLKAELSPLKEDVAILKSEDRKQEAVAAMRSTLWKAAATVATLIVTAAGAVIALH